MRSPRLLHPVRVAALALAMAAAGCLARRELVVTSEPSGAEVRVDEQLVGKTPLTLPFQHYGKRRVSLYLDGHISSSDVVTLRPPWYGRFPLDLVTEVLVPIGWKQRVDHHVELEPGSGKIPAPDLRGVLERAELMRRAGPDGPREPPRDPEPAPDPAEEEGPPAPHARGS